MKSKKMLCLLGLSALILTGCGDKTLPEINKADGLAKLQDTITKTGDWEGLSVKESAKINAKASSENQLMPLNFELSASSNFSGNVELNNDEIAKINAGKYEEVDYSNLASASLTTQNSVKLNGSMKTGTDGKESTVKVDASANGSVKYGKASYQNIDSDFLIASLNAKSKVESDFISDGTSSNEQKLDYGIYNIAANLGLEDTPDVPDTGSIDISFDFSGLQDLVAQYDSYISFGAKGNELQIRLTANDKLLKEVLANTNFEIPSLPDSVKLGVPHIAAESTVFINLYTDENDGITKFEIDASKLSFAIDVEYSGLKVSCSAELGFSFVVSKSSKEVSDIKASDFAENIKLYDLSSLIK